MKRRLVILASFLLLGAVVNVAVALGSDSWNRHPSRVMRVLRQRVNVLGFVEYTEEYYDNVRARPRAYTVGWPTATLGYTWTLDDGRLAPLRPIWPGFAINTLFYATLLWLLAWGPFPLRRSLRLRRGLCPTCAYPMGESAVCTECGRLLPKRVAT